MNIGIIGCGNISGIYFESQKKFETLNIVAAADLDLNRAKAKAEEYNVAKAYTPDELIADPEVDIVLNLTVPKAHYDVSLAALQAGKHVYVEKPISLTRDQGQHLLRIAAEKGLFVGSAPDTFLGAGLQTCRRLIDEGVIGEPIGASAFMLGHGPESWHPDPEFFYKVGAGPLFDMGPYYLTALISLIGPIKRVTGSARITFLERTVTSAPKFGTIIDVETPTHIAGVIDFVNGAVATLTTSFDVWASSLPPIEIYGSKGSLAVPDPNNFGGTVKVWTEASKEWTEVPVAGPYSSNSRGIGLADMVYAITTGSQQRASGALAYHVLEAMHGILEASVTGTHYAMSSTCSQPAALPEAWPQPLS